MKFWDAFLFQVMVYYSAFLWFVLTFPFWLLVILLIVWLKFRKMEEKKMIKISDLSDDLAFMYSTVEQCAKAVNKPIAPRVARSYQLLKKILENFWIEGEPGHEEYHVYPKAFGDEEDVRL